MKKLALGLLLMGSVACSGGKKVMIQPDSPTAITCDALHPEAIFMNEGCMPTEKCTWVYDQLMPTRVGHVGCVATGAVAVDGACTTKVGADDCVVGAACNGAVCKALCNPDATVAPMCDMNHTCTQYQQFFEDSQGNNVAGVCDPACDPLTQDLKLGTTKTACGSPTATKPTAGCYGYETFGCSAVAPTVSIDVALTLVDQSTPAGAYLNSCAPGYIPRLLKMTGATDGICDGLCAALEIDNTAAHTGNTLGDATASAKLPTAAAPAVGNAVCTATKKGAPTGTDSECRFLYPFNAADHNGMVLDTPYVDTLGVCLKRSNYTYKDAAGMTKQEPACNTLPPRSAATTGMDDDAADFGCQKIANSQFDGKSRTVEVSPMFKDVRFMTKTVMLEPHVIQ